MTTMSASPTSRSWVLLHEGGWDEVVMVAVGLVVAWAVIAFTGRRRDDEDDEEQIDQGNEGRDA